MYGCESWTITKAERQRIDPFELWCWRRLLRITWTTRRSNQAILKEINPDYSLEGQMLKLKLKFWPLDAKNRFFGKDPDAGKDPYARKDWRQKRRGWQRMRSLDSIIDSMDKTFSTLWEVVKERGAWHAAVHGVAKSQTWFSNCTTATKDLYVKVVRVWVNLFRKPLHLI